MIVFVCFVKHEWNLYFMRDINILFLKCDCLLFSVNKKLFFNFIVMCETVFRRGIGDPP